MEFQNREISKLKRVAWGYATQRSSVEVFCVSSATYVVA